jgi:hypothetical protein
MQIIFRKKFANGLDLLCVQVYTKDMATKTEVQRKADKTGCELRVDGTLIDLIPPAGYMLGEYRTVLRESCPGYLTKADIYDELLDLMDDLHLED